MYMRMEGSPLANWNERCRLKIAASFWEPLIVFRRNAIVLLNFVQVCVNVCGYGYAFILNIQNKDTNNERKNTLKFCAIIKFHRHSYNRRVYIFIGGDLLSFLPLFSVRCFLLSLLLRLLLPLPLLLLPLQLMRIPLFCPFD